MISTREKSKRRDLSAETLAELRRRLKDRNKPGYWGANARAWAHKILRERKNPAHNPRATAATSTGDAVAAHELYLFAINEPELYRQRIVPVINNLRKKVKKGVYRADLALKLWRYVADDAAKRYTHGMYRHGPGYGIFTVPIREKTARELAKYYDEAVRERKNPKKDVDLTPHRATVRVYRQLSVPDKHQLKIAWQTLRYSDVGARIMGGPTKEEAREIIFRLTGKRPLENPHKKNIRLVTNPDRTSYAYQGRQDRLKNLRGQGYDFRLRSDEYIVTFNGKEIFHGSILKPSKYQIIDEALAIADMYRARQRHNLYEHHTPFQVQIWRLGKWHRWENFTNLEFAKDQASRLAHQMNLKTRVIKI